MTDPRAAPDICERLRDPEFQGWAQHLRSWHELDEMHTEASDLIDRLRAENAELRREAALTEIARITQEDGLYE